jgi:hypothetical protein
MAGDVSQPATAMTPLMMRFWAASSIDPSAPKPLEPKLSALEAYIHSIDRCEAIGDRLIHDARAQELGDADIRSNF